MGSRSLGLLAVLLLPALAAAQNYPYFPPPGLIWVGATGTLSGTTFALGGQVTINQITIPANITPITAISGTDGIFNSGGDLNLGHNWGGGTAGSVQCNFTSTWETMQCFQGQVTYLESSDPGMGFTLVEDSANTSTNDVSIHLMDQNGSQGGFGYTANGSTKCPGENASVPTPPVTSMCMYIIGGGAGGAGLGPVMITTQGTNENVNNLYADQTQLFLAVAHNYSTTAVAEKVLTAADNGSGVVATVLGNSGASDTTTITAPASGIVLQNVTTGTNADFVCFGAGGIVLLQASACTISSLRFKEDLGLLKDASRVLELHPENFRMKPTAVPNPDPNYNHPQVGLIAEDVAKVLPECAVYESDMKTPKSYRAECVTAFLVKVAQDHQKYLQNNQATIESYHHQLRMLFAICFLLTAAFAFHTMHLHERISTLERL